MQRGETKKSLRLKQKGISTPAGLDLLTAFLQRFMHWDRPGRGRLNLALKPLLLLVKPEPRSPEVLESLRQPREPIKVSPRSRHEAEVTGQGHGRDVAAANNHLLPHDIIISCLSPNLAADTFNSVPKRIQTFI